MADQPPIAKEQRGRGWLRRVLARFATRPRRGDVIAANVDAGARGVAVGKNIVQIGTLNVPVWPLLALLLALLVGAGAGALALRGPSRMPEGQFNLAVARIGERDMEGRLAESGATAALGAAIYAALSGQRDLYRDTPGGAAGAALGIWRDGSAPWREQGADVGLVQGEAEAEATAQRLNADVLIYGTVADGRLALQFYVAPRAQLPGDANALIGRSAAGGYQFGDTIRLERVGASYRSEAVSRRASALFWLVKGLEAESAGRFDDALDRLAKAEQLLSRLHDGREVPAFFKGEASYYAALAPGLPQAEVEGRLGEAERFFQEALAQNSGFARAQIGLGSVALHRFALAEADPDAQRAAVDAALAAYEQAGALAARSPERGWAETVATLGLGTAQFVKGGMLFDAGDDAAAQPLLERAAALLDGARPALEAAGDQRLLALTLLNRGNTLFSLAQLLYDRPDLARSRALYEEAGAMYDACAALADAAPGDELVAQFADECQGGRRDVDQALTNPFTEGQP